jgi:3-oxoacyl-[acyl-carrier-protein] synthase-1
VTHLDATSRHQAIPAPWLATLAAPAFKELRRELGLSRRQAGPTGLFVALPESGPGLPGDLAEQFAYHFHNYVEEDPVAHVQFVRSGHTGALQLCDDACRLLAAGRIEHAIVGGVDSYLFPERLACLDEAYRIASDRSLDGFCPGEAAAFVHIESTTQAARRGAKARLILSGSAATTSTPAPGQPNTGEALFQLLNGLLPANGPSPVLVCDLNGERTRMKEWGFALARLGSALRTPYALEHPARQLGDVGAASAALLMVLASGFLRTRYADRPSALVWTASDTGDRRGVLLERVYDSIC